mgnify:CR=1 FL=1
MLLTCNFTFGDVRLTPRPRFPSSVNAPTFVEVSKNSRMFPAPLCVIIPAAVLLVASTLNNSTSLKVVFNVVVSPFTIKFPGPLMSACMLDGESAHQRLALEPPFDRAHAYPHYGSSAFSSVFYFCFPYLRGGTIDGHSLTCNTFSNCFDEFWEARCLSRPNNEVRNRNVWLRLYPVDSERFIALVSMG